MSYKLKSLIYLMSFVASAILYYSLETKTGNIPSADTMEVPKTDLEKIGPKNNITMLSYQEEE